MKRAFLVMSAIALCLWVSNDSFARGGRGGGGGGGRGG